jgi:hypothetical protein
MIGTQNILPSVRALDTKRRAGRALMRQTGQREGHPMASTPSWMPESSTSAMTSSGRPDAPMKVYDLFGG